MTDKLKIKLEELAFDNFFIKEFEIRAKKSKIPCEIEIILTRNDSDKTIISKLIKLLLDNDELKPITVSVKQLSAITGLSPRKLNDLRKANVISSRKLSGGTGAGRKTYVYELEKVLEQLKASGI